jgi:hypothetical protein
VLKECKPEARNAVLLHWTSCVRFVVGLPYQDLGTEKPRSACLETAAAGNSRSGSRGLSVLALALLALALLTLTLLSLELAFGGGRAVCSVQIWLNG